MAESLSRAGSIKANASVSNLSSVTAPVSSHRELQSKKSNLSGATTQYAASTQYATSTQYAGSHGALQSKESVVRGENAIPNDNAADTPNQQESPRDVHGATWFLVTASILMANLLFALDNTIVANIQPAVVKQFDALDKISWLSVSFFLSSWGTNLLWGNVYARFSTKWTFFASFVTFSIGSAVCGSAPNIDALIVGRAICGLGGAGMYYGSVTLLTMMTSEKERPLYLNFVGITFGAGTVLGPIIGGLFVGSSAGWRWAFYLNLVVGGVCAPVYLFLLPKLDPRPGQSIKSRATEIDYLGSVLLCGLIISIVMAISFGGVEFAWNSGQVIALFVLAFVLLWVFLGQQTFTVGTTAEQRIFPIHFLKSSTMVVLLLEVASAATCVFVPVYFLPLYFQFVKADTAITAGVRMLPFVAFLVFIMISSGWYISRTGYYVPWYIFSGVCCTAGAALLFTTDQFTPLANVYGYEILIGIGAGASAQLSFAVASIRVDPVDIPRSTGWCTFGQLGGPSIALSIANSVFLNRAQQGIAALLPNLSASEISSIISDPSSTILQDVPQSVRDQILTVIVNTMRNAYILCIIAGVLVLLLAFRFKLNSKLYGQIVVAG